MWKTLSAVFFHFPLEHSFVVFRSRKRNKKHGLETEKQTLLENGKNKKRERSENGRTTFWKRKKNAAARAPEAPLGQPASHHLRHVKKRIKNAKKRKADAPPESQPVSLELKLPGRPGQEEKRKKHVLEKRTNTKKQSSGKQQKKTYRKRTNNAKVENKRNNVKIW